MSIQNLTPANVDQSGNLSVNVQNLPVIAVSDTDGNLVGVTDNALDVNVKSESTVGITDSTGQAITTTNGALNVNIQSPLPVPVTITTPISFANIPTIQSVIEVAPVVVQSNPSDAFVCSLADTDGNLVGVTDNALDVNVKYESTVGITDSSGQALSSTTGALNVAVQGSVPVTPSLPTNAAQETGGNLALMTSLQSTLNAVVFLLQANTDMLRQTNATLNAMLTLEQANCGQYFDRDDALNADPLPIN